MDECRRQEHDRQGRVPADRRAGAALRGHARRPVARARRRTGHRAARPPGRARPACSPGWRSSGAGSSAAGAAGKATVRAQPGHGRPTSRCAGRSSATTGRSSPARAHGGRALPPRGRRPRRALRREHHRRRRHPRVDLRRVLRAGRGHRAPPWTASRPRTGARHPGARRRGLRRHGRALPRPRPGLGLPAASGWPRSTPPATSTAWSTRASGGCCGATTTTCPRSWSSASTTWAATCRRSRSTSRGPAPRWSRSTTRSSGSGREGYRRVQQASRDVALHLSPSRSRRSGRFRLHHRRRRAAGVRLHDGRRTCENFDVFDVSRRLRERGWLVPAYTFPDNRAGPVRAAVRRAATASPTTWPTCSSPTSAACSPASGQPPETAETIRPSFHH